MGLSAKDMIRILKSNGFKEIRQNGSHKFFRNEETGRTTIVPIHMGDLKKGTENKILKDAGLK